MATVKQDLPILAAILPASGYAQFTQFAGTSFPVPSIAFDAASEEAVYFLFPAVNYGSGNVTLRLQWYADSATSGDIKFGASLGAITPNTDTQDIETKALATEDVATDTHLGTTGQRLHEFTITITDLDSVASGDFCVLKLARKAADAADTLAGDCLLVGAQVEYSDV